MIPLFRPTSLARLRRRLIAAGLAAVVIIAAACGPDAGRTGGGNTSLPATLAELPAVRLNFRYEADVPAPEIPASPAENRNELVQADFDNNRTGEVLDRTLTSPDKRRVLAIYHASTDLPAEFRLDMYSADGRLLNKITPDMVAVHFPDTIVWSPDSANLAFVAMVRGEQGPRPEGAPGEGPGTPAATPPTPTDANANAAEPAESPAAAPAAQPTPAAPIGVLAFRTEQIYLCDADGRSLKPLTQTEGLIYFYYAWAPDSSALVALAATAREWQYLQYRADEQGEMFIPVGRPRLVEKNGRERRLDDGLTAVQPAWSPDSAKVAVAYETQVRIYDAAVNAPTQAALPLRNGLLLSAQAYDQRQQAQAGEGNVAPTPTPQSPTTLPDPSTLVSFNPIVSLSWPSPELLYFQTAFIKRMKVEADSVTSYSRWHRVILSPQPAAAQPQTAQ